MPELPEVETMCRCVAPAVGSRIVDLVRPKSRLQSILISPRIDHFRRRVVGKTIAGIRRIGKRVVLELADGDDAHPSLRPECDGPFFGRPRRTPLPTNCPSLSAKGTERLAADGTSAHKQFEQSGPPIKAGCPVMPDGDDAAQYEYIVLEPRMTGLVLLANPPNTSHVRLVFQLDGLRAEQILFWDQRGLGVARLLTHRELWEHLGPDQIGPDALAITADILRQRLGNSRRAIKVALLDQSAVAGIGNLYAAEIVHHAAIDPATPCQRLRAADWNRIHAAIQEILTLAIRHQGSTLGDGTYRIAKNTPGDFQIFHRVYGREGDSCLRCGNASIVRIVQAQRSTFYCPACQRSCRNGRKR